jgi:Holliday junction resolvase RusA-like endonuclease
MWSRCCVKIEFEVKGLPVTQGSLRAYSNPHTGRAVVVHAAPQPLRNWRNAVASQASDAMKGRPPVRGAVRLQLEFWLPRPQGHYGTGRNKWLLKPSAPMNPTKKPDLDKLMRAVLDALKGIAWADDALVTEVKAAKRFTDANEAPYLWVELLTDD